MCCVEVWNSAFDFMERMLRAIIKCSWGRWIAFLIANRNLGEAYVELKTRKAWLFVKGKR